MIYSYHSIRVKKGSWRRVARETTAAIGGSAQGASAFGLFAGMIGFASDEGALITVWPDGDACAANSARMLRALPAIIDAANERLVPTSRPIDATPPIASGVYAHRWFWLQPQDWAEFQRLSEEDIWPYFESDRCRIIGLWRSMEPGQPAKALLITYYPTVSHWERTRLQSPEPPPGANERLYRRAQDAAIARNALTERSIVRLAQLVLPPA